MGKGVWDATSSLPLLFGPFGSGRTRLNSRWVRDKLAGHQQGPWHRLRLQNSFLGGIFHTHADDSGKTRWLLANASSQSTIVSCKQCYLLQVDPVLPAAASGDAAADGSGFILIIERLFNTTKVHLLQECWLTQLELLIWIHLSKSSKHDHPSNLLFAASSSLNRCFSIRLLYLWFCYTLLASPSPSWTPWKERRVWWRQSTPILLGKNDIEMRPGLGELSAFEEKLLSEGFYQEGRGLRAVTWTTDATLSSDRMFVLCHFNLNLYFIVKVINEDNN